MPRASKPSSTFCCTVSQGSRAKVWNTIAVPRLHPVTRTPSKRTSPSEGAINPAMQRSRVDFPLPLRPSRATNSPLLTSRSMPSSTLSSFPSGSAYALVRSETRTIGGASTAGEGAASPAVGGVVTDELTGRSS